MIAPKWGKLPAQVEVEWEDAFLLTEQQTAAELLEHYCPALQRTTGWLVHRDDRIIIVSLSLISSPSDTPTFNDTMFIPMGMVRRVRKIPKP